MPLLFKIIGRNNVSQILRKIARKAFCNSRNFSLKMSSIPLKDTMQAWQTDGFYGIEGLNLNITRVPIILRPNEVLVKVSAASVNPLDTAVIDGYGRVILKFLKTMDDFFIGKCETDPPEFPLTVGRDFVGDVVRVGQSVSNIKVNDRVWGVVLPQRQGSHAEYVVTESYNLCNKPRGLSDVEAASIPYIGLTSWSAAVVTGGLEPNDCFDKRVMVLGASGGIGTFITQLLSAWGAHVTGICSENAFELALSCGVDEVYDYKDDSSIMSLISRPSFDLIIDAAGTNDLTYTNGLKEWNNASYISLYSPLLRDTDYNGIVRGLVKSAVKLVGSNTIFRKGRMSKWAYFMPNEFALKEIARLMESGKIKPVIDKVFHIDEAKSAYEHMRYGTKRGKTVIYFNDKNAS